MTRSPPRLATVHRPLNYYENNIIVIDNTAWDRTVISLTILMRKSPLYQKKDHSIGMSVEYQEQKVDKTPRLEVWIKVGGGGASPLEIGYPFMLLWPEADPNNHPTWPANA